MSCLKLSDLNGSTTKNIPPGFIEQTSFKSYLWLHEKIFLNFYDWVTSIVYFVSFLFLNRIIAFINTIIIIIIILSFCKHNVNVLVFHPLEFVLVRTCARPKCVICLFYIFLLVVYNFDNYRTAEKRKLANNYQN